LPKGLPPKALRLRSAAAIPQSWSARYRRSARRGARGVLADPATAEGAAALIAAVPDVDILVNNLGIYEAKPFAEISDADWHHIFEVNVVSGARLARHYFRKCWRVAPGA
jgi:NAD(P)-dependent dehydrogenase (short-subunit alcohol dehydrogenase family)